MISISISCEESEIPALQGLMAGIFAKSAGFIEVDAPIPESQDLAKNFIIADAPRDHGKVEPIVVDLGTIKQSAWNLRPDTRANILQLHEAGKTMAEIKESTGITDGRIVNGILARGRKKPRVKTEPPLSEKVKTLRDQGVCKTEAAARLGADPKEVKKVYVAESNAEDAREKAEIVAGLRPLSIVPDVVKRILDLSRSGLTPRGISDTLEEEIGLVLSATEIMDVILRDQKKLL